MSTQYKNKGFTLVELSIVIVIIGLIAAGVTAGKSLVYQAKLRSTINEFNKLKTAYHTFRLQYNQLPGDISNAYDYWGANCDATPANCNGNGNGKVDWDTAITAQHNENFRIWQHLSLSRIVPDSWDASLSGGWGIIGTSLPASAYPSKDGEGPTAWGAMPGHFILGGLVRMGGCHECTMWPASDAIAPADAYAIDRKIDDGIRDIGKVVSWNGKMDVDFWSTQCNSATDPTKYNINITGPGCAMSFWL